MKSSEAQKKLQAWDQQGRYVFSKADLAKILGGEKQSTINATIKRLIEAGVLEHAAHDVYVYRYSSRIGATTLEEIALSVRRGHYVFESLESALSQWGIISQIPIDRLTCMTTGRSGEYHTPYGAIEFTHTAKGAREIIENTIVRPGHRLPMATKRFALANLKRVGRNVDLVQEMELA